jgi:hypothetical protein
MTDYSIGTLLEFFNWKRSKEMKALNKSSHITTIILCKFRSHNSQVLTNLWETDDMNNGIFFLNILA